MRELLTTVLDLLGVLLLVLALAIWIAPYSLPAALAAAAVALLLLSWLADQFLFKRRSTR